jgi:peptidoglycan-N-acetylmuramic acid deacetylase
MRKQDFGVLGLAVLMIVAMVLFPMMGDVIETGAWGLSFRTEGSPPIGPAGSDELRRYDAAYLGDPTDKVIYLTFDAGYENGSTAKILDILKKHQVPAAFFLVGNYMEKNADLVRRMVEEGHIVGNHTMHHPDMSKLTDKAAFQKELTDLEDCFRTITGKELPKFYRPPQGLYSAENLKMAQEMGYKTVFWSLAYVDWNNDSQPTADYAFSKLLPRIHNGAVVLLHSTSKTNAQILDELLTKWKEMGYSFCTLEELYN